MLILNNYVLSGKKVGLEKCYNVLCRMVEAAEYMHTANSYGNLEIFSFQLSANIDNEFPSNKSVKAVSYQCDAKCGAAV